MFPAEPDGLVVLGRVLELGENVFVSERLAIGIDVGVPAGDVKERRHFLDVLFRSQRVRLAGWLECVVARGRDPVMLEVAPSSAQREGMHRSGMAVTRQHARGPNPKDVDIISLARVQAARPEREPGILYQHPSGSVLGRAVASPPFRTGACLHAARKMALPRA